MGTIASHDVGGGEGGPRTRSEAEDGRKNIGSSPSSGGAASSAGASDASSSSVITLDSRRIRIFGVIADKLVGKRGGIGSGGGGIGRRGIISGGSSDLGWSVSGGWVGGRPEGGRPTCDRPSCGQPSRGRPSSGRTQVGLCARPRLWSAAPLPRAKASLGAAPLVRVPLEALGEAVYPPRLPGLGEGCPHERILGV